MVVAWLLDGGHHEAALDLVAELRPLMHRLRFTPRLRRARRRPARPSGWQSVGEVPARCAAAGGRRRLVATMRETLRVWHPLYDRLVALWCDTVDGELPRLAGGRSVAGGWPCRVWPADWARAPRRG